MTTGPLPKSGAPKEGRLKCNCIAPRTAELTGHEFSIKAAVARLSKVYQHELRLMKHGVADHEYLSFRLSGFDCRIQPKNLLFRACFRRQPRRLSDGGLPLPQHARPAVILNALRALR
jgi:hypothetical protein